MLFVRLLASLIALCCAGCGAATPLHEDATAAPEQTALEQDPDYIIGPGDVLRIFVLDNKDLSTDVPVRPDGKITIPLVNDIVAVGKTSAQLGKDLEAKLKSYVRTPTISVIILQATSTFSQVKVIGQAVAPRALPYRSGMRVLDVMIAVNGLSQFAAGNRAKIIRTENGTPRQIKLRLDDLMNDGDTSQNLLVSPGDVIVIPEARF